ncbi:MAG TPA: metal ABC transporter permease [Verrucomicrobiae bacterium]|nr:metal ABC transporter permease [Verrucomicrobiae bacterium]
MHWLLEPFHFEFMQKALLGCLLIGFTNGYLSGFIVLRRHALLADALSHSLLPGVATGVLIWGLQPMGLFVGALVAALLVVVGGKMISRSSRIKDDTSIGALYVIAFAVGIILLKYSPVRVDLSHFLFGNVLGLSNMDLCLTYALSSIILLILAIVQRQLLLVLFDPAVALSLGIRVAWFDYLLIALMVVAMISSLQAVGIVLSLGLLILPAATIYLLSDSFAVMVWGGAALGVGGAVAGLMLSYWADLPSGPAIVLVLGLGFVLAYLFGPRYGVIPKLLRPRHLHEESMKRWKDHDHV